MKLRMKLLAELVRVASGSIIISLWADGNLTARKRKRREAKCGKKQYQNRFVIPQALIEDEFREGGLTIEAGLALPGFNLNPLKAARSALFSNGNRTTPASHCATRSAAS